MKKMLLILTAFLLAASLTACSSSNSTSGKDTTFDDKGAEDVYAEGAPAENPNGGIYATNNVIPPAAGTLTAGEWIDNDHYSFWRELFQKSETDWEEYRSLWDRDFCSRVFVTVEAGGKPLENSSLTLTNAKGEVLWRAKTDNEGKAYLFYVPSELSKGELVVKSDFGGEMTVDSDESAVSFIIDQAADKPSGSLDLALVADTTGSMSDELSYLQKELESVIERTVKDNGNIPVRLSVNFYRDDGDDYVVKNYPFTDDISGAIKILNQQGADGGGDNPEKVNKALDSVINGLSWEENSVKLLFIILDAPPHSDDISAVEQMNTLTYQAAEKGIRVIPILASGGDKETEFLMRDFALKTGGSYLFLTDDSGVSAGEHITPTIGEYTVEKLNDLMVKVINRYLANVEKTAEYIDIKTDLLETESTAEPHSDTSISLSEEAYNSDTPAESENPVPVEPLSTDISTSDTEEYPHDNFPQNEITMTLSGSSDDSLEFTIYNGSEYEYAYEYAFSLEKLVDDEWINIPPDEDFEVIEIAVLIEPGKSSTFKAPVFKYWKTLEDGRYRIAINNSELYGEFIQETEENDDIAFNV